MENEGKKNVESEKAKEKRKRGQYHERQCPYCKRMVRNLPNHIKLAHPQESPEAPAAELTKEDLLTGEKKKEPAPSSNVNEKLYYCTNCTIDGKHPIVAKGEIQCWNCGAFLDWTGIE